ncbi:hypothetical protein AB0451_03165 [Streptomyces sp. NPDC052000]|uniref:hypothetical protein n=1 Tax=Streptomyces sp. NPDC052000 TaxID=3155676 RepID=UPI00344E1AE4
MLASTGSNPERRRCLILPPSGDACGAGEAHPAATGRRNSTDGGVMARIQVLQLPDSLDEIAPFLLIFDQAQDLIAANEALDYDPLAALKAATGARHVFITAATVDVR